MLFVMPKMCQKKRLSKYGPKEKYQALSVAAVAEERACQGEI